MKLSFQFVIVLTAGLGVVAAPVPHQERAIQERAPSILEKELWKRANQGHAASSSVGSTVRHSGSTGQTLSTTPSSAPPLHNPGGGGPIIQLQPIIHAPHPGNPGFFPPVAPMQHAPQNPPQTSATAKNHWKTAAAAIGCGSCLKPH